MSLGNQSPVLTPLETRVPTLGLDANGFPTLSPLFKVYPKPSEDHQLKADWKSKVPDVWELSINKVRARLLRLLFDLTDKKIAEIMALYPKYEPDTWKEKVDLADKWLALDPNGKEEALEDISYLLLFTEAVGQISPAISDVAEITSLATKIRVNRLIFGAYVGSVLKYKTALQNTITQTNNTATLLALQVAIPVNLGQVALDVRALL